MKCKNCKQHAEPLYNGLCYKCSSDRLQVIRNFSDRELDDEIERRRAVRQADVDADVAAAESEGLAQAEAEAAAAEAEAQAMADAEADEYHEDNEGR